MSAPEWAVGMRRLQPGVYVKGTALHLDLEELCAMNGLPATPENCRRLQKVAEKELRRIGGRIGREIPVRHGEALMPIPELTAESDARTKLRAMVDAAEYFNSTLTQVICRDDDENVISVGVVAVGEDAVALARWLERRAQAEARREKGRA